MKRRILAFAARGDVTHVEIARQLHVSRQYVSRIVGREAAKYAGRDRPDTSYEIARACGLLDITLTELAEIIGVRREMVSRYVNRRMLPSSRVARRISALLRALEQLDGNQDSKFVSLL